MSLEFFLLLNGTLTAFPQWLCLRDVCISCMCTETFRAIILHGGGDSIRHLEKRGGGVIGESVNDKSIAKWNLVWKDLTSPSLSLSLTACFSSVLSVFYMSLSHPLAHILPWLISDVSIKHPSPSIPPFIAP